MIPIEHQFRDFIEFAERRLECGVEAESLKELDQQWRHDAEYSAAVADVRHGIDDDAAGLGEPVAKAFSDIRRQLGIGD